MVGQSIRTASGASGRSLHPIGGRRGGWFRSKGPLGAGSGASASCPHCLLRLLCVLRRCCREVSERYPDIEYEEMIVDNTCMQVI